MRRKIMKTSGKSFHFYDKKRAASIVPPIKNVVFYSRLPMMKIQKMERLVFILRISGDTDRTNDIVDDRHYECIYPSVLIKRPGETWYCNPEHHVDSFFFSYDPGTLGFFQRHGLPETLTEMHLTDPEVFTPMLNRMRELLKSSEEFGMADRIDLLGFQIFAEIVLQWEKQNSPIGQMDQRIFQAASYLRFHFLEEIDFVQLAADYGFSYRTFLRRWDDAGYPTPAVMLFNLRMEEARRLLAETDLSISEIASRLRYHSCSWFCAAFKKKNGQSALAYRKKSRLSGRVSSDIFHA